MIRTAGSPKCCSHAFDHNCEVAGAASLSHCSTAALNCMVSHEFICSVFDMCLTVASSQQGNAYAQLAHLLPAAAQNSSQVIDISRSVGDIVVGLTCARMPFARGRGVSRKLQWDPGRGFLTIQPQPPEGPKVVCQAGGVLTTKHEDTALHSAHAVPIAGLWPHPIHLQLCPHRPAQQAQ